MAPADDRPTIIVAMDEQLPDSQLTQLLLGIEEEAIPYSVQRLASSDVRFLAHQAAISSRLGIGVGASSQAVAVTTEKLPQGQPYIIEQLNLTPTLDRAIGSNAARLVKRMPLRELRGDN